MGLDPNADDYNRPTQDHGSSWLSSLESGDDNGFEERWAQFVPLPAGMPLVIVGTKHPHTNIDVYVTTNADPALLGATLNIYAKTTNSRCLLATFTLQALASAAAGTQRFSTTGAADGFDVELLSIGTSTLTSNVTAIAYGWESSSATGGGGGGVSQGRLILVTVPFTYASGTLTVLGISPGYVIDSATVQITTAFNGTGSSIEFGPSAVPNALLGPSDVVPTVNGSYQTSDILLVTTTDNLQLAVVGGTSTAGAGTLIFRYKS